MEVSWIAHSRRSFRSAFFKPYTDAKIARDLEEAASARVTIRPIEASLEDVFVRWTRIQIEQRGEVPERAQAAS